METLRWGILSTANIGVARVVPGIQQADRCEVVAIGSRDPARAREAAGTLGIPRAHGSYEELLADPDVDAIYNPLPNHLHLPWSLQALEAGKHVLCEKPIGLSSAEARELKAASERTGRVLVEAFMYRLHPSWLKIRELVESGRIGDLLTIQSWFSYFNDDPQNIRNIAEYGGGALMDIGCYNVNLSRMLFGSEPTGVTATITRDPASGVDVLTSAMLEFGEAVSTFTVATRLAGDQRVHLVGSGGRIEAGMPFNPAPDAVVPVRLWEGRVASGEDPTEIFECGPVDQYGLQAEAFAATVLDGAAPHVSLDDSIANMEAIEAIFAAAGR